MSQIILKINTHIRLCEEHDGEVDADIIFNFIPIKEIRLRTIDTVCGKNISILTRNWLCMLL
jgi:hypothetical protein